jgi:NAD-dependent deacetylase
MITIQVGRQSPELDNAVATFLNARCAVALTGAGISVNSGIADFRSPGGVWTRYAPEEYATLTAFQRDPEKAWRLYREMGQELQGKQPNKGHRALARLEEGEHLRAVITQNVDALHQAAGSRNVLEIHGDHLHLQCLDCAHVIPLEKEQLLTRSIPRCPLCDYPLKPNVVLFGEAVRQLEAIEHLVLQCDLLLVIGTSASVYPAASLPQLVKANGGLLFEFNLEPALSTSAAGQLGADVFFQGDLSKTLPKFEKSVSRSP